MRFGLSMPGFEDDPPPVRFYVDTAQEVEELGFDSMFAGDHIFGYSPNPDPLALVSAYAAATNRITVGTGVLLLALREPAVVAKQVATIDSLAEGRMVLGVGLGGEMPQEWAGMEVPLRGRGRRLDEYLQLLRLLWSGEILNFTGEFRSISGVRGTPTPSSPGGPPIWVGGRSDAAVRRALFHQGWCAYATSPETLAARVAAIRKVAPIDFQVSTMVFVRIEDQQEAALDGANRMIAAMYRQDFREILGRVGAVGDPDHVRTRIGMFVAAGVDEIIFCPVVEPGGMANQLERLAHATSQRR